MKKLFILLLIHGLYCYESIAQVTPPTVQACGTEQTFCLDQSIFDLCVKITVTSGLPADIDHFEIDWGDNSAVTPVPGSSNPSNQNHTYDLSDFYLTCSYEEKFFVVLETFLINGDVLNSSFQVTFQNPPQAFFNINPTVICVGEEACFNDDSCPTENLSIVSWDYDDGSPLGTDDCHTYNQVGTYNVVLTVENNCGTASTTQQLTVINPPEARIAVTTNNIDVSSTPFIYCLGSGGVGLDGDSLSLNENAYEWQSLSNVPGASWVLPPDAPSPNDGTPNIPDLAVSFSDTGFYELILEVDNACNQPDFDTIQVQVLSGEALSQPNQPDGCMELSYTPENFNPNATYTINGVLQSIFPTVLGIGSYEVICNLTNECGSQTTVDNFEVFDAVEVNILSPFPDTTICLNSDSIMILYGPLGGVWTGENLLVQGDSVFFNPVSLGEFELTYGISVGVGTACDDVESITITVIDSGIEVFDQEVCSTSAPFPMGATPSNGIYTSIDCPSCIQNDTFIISELLLTGLNSVSVDYSIMNSVGCEGSNSFTVRIDDPIAIFSLEETYCVGDLIVPDISGTNGTISWTIDGQNVGTPPFNTTTLGVGSHTITMIAIAGDCDVEYTDMITIFNLPTNVGFVATPLEGCADLEVMLTNTTPNFDNESYEWYINDSLFAEVPNPGSVLLGQGLSDTIYTISLIAGNSCDGAIFEQDITVLPRPVPQFGPMQDVYCSGDTVTFSNVSFGGPMSSWLWDYGNGTTSTDSIPLSVIYLADTIPINYTVSLTAANDCGSERFDYELVILPTDVKAFFNISPLEGCSNSEVCLTNLSTLGANILWDFGDGNTSTKPNICHTYSDPGTYTIMLKAFGCGFDSIQQEVVIHPSPETEFTHNFIACPGEPVNFDNLTIGASSYQWDFGDGNTSTLNNPSHVYVDSDTYQISLLATSIDGCQNSTSGSITVLVPPVADFSISTDSICSGEVIGFANNSNSNILTCFWDFGDGSTSNQCDPFHSYDTAGSFNITLVVSDNNNCRDTTRQTISVSSVPVPSFSATPNQDCSPVIMSFSNTSVNADSFIWDFGDGNTSTAINPIHSYLVGGNYTVQLTAINGVCSETNILEVNINQTPSVNIEIPTGQEGCAGFEVHFISNSDTESIKFDWDFGDGINSFDANPTHIYSTAGVYEATLFAEDTISGCLDTAFVSIEVFEQVEANGTVSDILCNGDSTGIVDINITSGTSPFVYNWSNDIDSQDQNQLTAGDYDVTIIDSNNCTWVDTFIVSEPSAISAIVADSSIATCFGDNDGSICLEVTGGVPEYSISWEIGLQVECIENVVAGEYPVEITDNTGCRENFVFEVFQNPQIELVDTFGSITCFGVDDGFIKLDSIYGGASDIYNTTLSGPRIFNGGNNFPGLLPGKYDLIIQDLEGCVLESNYIIGEPDSLWVTIFDDTLNIGLGDNVILNSSHNVGDPLFMWSPSETLDCEDCEDPVAKPFSTTTYYLSLFDLHGCSAMDTVTIIVDSNKEFYIPNTFTPNGDGRNDFFRIRSRLNSIRQINSFRIFNRGGDMVFEAENFRPQAENFDHAWDGTFRGKQLAPDQFTYYAEVEYLDGEVELAKGTILLMR